MTAENIVVLGTGGTIAGLSAQAGDNVGYTAAQVAVGQLLLSVQGLGELGVSVESEQVAQIDSKDMEFGVWRALALRCEKALADPSVRGVVVTHGTDTLEETAWFLSSVLAPGKPVVLTCAMRPASSLAPDGPQNLLDAAALVMDAASSGVLVVAAGQVHSAQRIYKNHPYRVDAFSSGDTGPLGWVEEGRVRWAQKPCALPDHPATLAVDAWRDPDRIWPRVEIVMNYAGAQGTTMDALVNDGVRGLVVACTGNGTMHHSLEAALVRAQARGVQVVRATRCTEGQLLSWPVDLRPDVRGLSPVKARIALMLHLMG